MKTISLRKRFFTNTAFVVATVMLVSLLVIDFSYVRKLEKSAQERLRLHIYTLLSVAQLHDGQLFVPTILYNPKFNRKESGLWAAVLDSTNQVQWHSLSIEQPNGHLTLAPDTGEWAFGIQTVSEQEYLTSAYNIEWEENQQRYQFHFLVAEDTSVVNDEISEFRVMLLITLCVITSSLLLFQFIVLKKAFGPISKLEGEIAAMEEGVIDHLSNDYPKELRGVTRNLNTLIEKEYQQRERYRSSMADLAHSLKTPITILNGELVNYPENKTMQDALARIDSSIEYQLRRAVITGHTLLDKGTQVEQVVELVKEAMEKIYSERSVTFKSNIEANSTFFGDENDLMEIIGNLLDNAFKYANKQVLISAIQIENTLDITVEDDGSGFTQKEAMKIFSRGERLDRQGLGQGIGLAVVYDIVTSYKGHIDASQSKLGGAKFHITFPDQRVSD